MRRGARPESRGFREATRLALVALALACGAPAPANPDSALYAHEDPRFQVVVERAAEGPLRARVEPRDPYHMATDFPFELELSAEGVELQRARQQRGEALEISEERVEFAVGLKGESTAGRLRGRFVFGVCKTDQICERVDHALDFALR